MNAGLNIPLWAWLVFGIVVLILLAVDHLAHRTESGQTRRAAAIWSAVWIGTGLLFTIFVWVAFGGRAAGEYLAVYLIEKSLSLDNLFVFLIIFQSLKIPRKYQHEVLFWGIFGAVVFRAIFVFAGAAALEQYAWVSYVFGAILLFAAWTTFREDPTEQEENRAVTWLSQHLPLTHNMHEGRFMSLENGKRVVTPLLIALIGIELTDILFAIDSVAAALSMTQNLFLVYSAMVFAILGLRALYLLVAHLIEDLKYLHYGLSAVLAFAGIKIMANDWLHHQFSEGTLIVLSIGFITAAIGASVWASLRFRKRHSAAEAAPAKEDEPEVYPEEEVAK